MMESMSRLTMKAIYTIIVQSSMAQYRHHLYVGLSCQFKHSDSFSPIFDYLLYNIRYFNKKQMHVYFYISYLRIYSKLCVCNTVGFQLENIKRQNFKQYNICQFKMGGIFTQSLFQKLGAPNLNQYQICPVQQQENHNSHKWCIYHVVDPQTLIIEWVYAVAIVAGLISFGILVRMLVSLRKKHPTSHLNASIYLLVYKIIIVWFLSSLIKIVVSLYVYQKFMSDDFKVSPIPDHPDPYYRDPIVIYTSIYNFSNFVSPFSINLLKLKIIYEWIFNILSNLHKKDELQLDNRKKIDRLFLLCKIIKIYYKYVRQVFLLILVTESIIFFFPILQMFKCRMTNFDYYYTIAQSVLIGLFYILGLIFFIYLKRKDLIRLKAKYQRILLLQYLLLILSAAIRIIINVQTLIVYNRAQHDQSQNPYIPNGNCSNMNLENNHQMLVMQILHNLLMHILPICTIIYIYRPNINKEEVSSIIFVDQYLNDEVGEFSKSIQSGPSTFIQSVFGLKKLDMTRDGNLTQSLLGVSPSNTQRYEN